MKYFFFAAIIALASCGGGAGENSKSNNNDATASLQNVGGTAIDSSQNMSGANLIASSDCLTCHQIDKEGFGPSYKRIANHYENNQGNIENLAHKIRYGGKGLWGNKAMTPHQQITNDQAEAMVAYIFTLKDAAK